MSKRLSEACAKLTLARALTGANPLEGASAQMLPGGARQRILASREQFQEIEYIHSVSNVS